MISQNLCKCYISSKHDTFITVGDYLQIVEAFIDR